ncbi:HNH endonuclease [Bradyrhizobium sp. SZCCHNRI1002]|uniref:HNH endonuclease n=1 Tax=Bradyrhizobium sp. SZCCHNRI1002 TaxID=3057274 RepID=UPI0028E83974|nr:HNH endonuclease [Bradyrhizobium sp. SZCCHNRI1002]
MDAPPQEHFVAYHNIDERGASLDRGRRGSFETRKPTLPRKGDVLWCFEGEGRPRDYRLVKRGVVLRSDKSSGTPSEVRYVASDIPDASVTGLPWFEKLRKAQGSFGLGLNRISDAKSIEDLERFAADVSGDAAERDVDAIRRDLSIPETTRKALIDARRGQGRFRRELDKRWDGACAVTNCAIRDLLRASHVKPWRDSDCREKLDSANGILLSANIDILFDKGFISFDDGGRMLISSLRLSPTEQRMLRLPANLRKKPTVPERAYLAQHRKSHGFDI